MQLLLIEDDQNLARGMALALKQSGYVVCTAATAMEAMRLAAVSRFDMGVLDLGLPDRDGIHLLHEMRRVGHKFPILILSARDGLNDRINGLDAGADDYLVKPFALGELEARLRALMRRAEVRGEACRLGRLLFDHEARQALIGEQPLELTAREMAILEILLKRVHKIVSKQVLFDAVFPMETEAAPNALEVHVSRLRHKLKHAGVNIRSLRGLGYRIEEHGGCAP